jgi:hypothetical protein
VSKDDDFRQLTFLHGAPPTVNWPRVGNGPTSVISSLLTTKLTTLSSSLGRSKRPYWYCSDWCISPVGFVAPGGVEDFNGLPA